MKRERLLHRSLHKVDGHRRLYSMPSYGFASGAMPYDHGLSSGEVFDEFSVRCVREHTLFPSREDSEHAILSMMEQVLKEKPSLEMRSRYFNPSTFASCKAVAHALLEAIAPMSEERVQVHCPSRQKRGEPLGSITPERYRDADEFNFLYIYIERMACVSNEIEYLT